MLQAIPDGACCRVSHDAGGAEILSSWLNHYSLSSQRCGCCPAESIFRRKCPQTGFYRWMMHWTGWLGAVCGTSWQGNNFERHAIAWGRALGRKRWLSLIHWVNLPGRFDEGGHGDCP